jgi:hypothetical protein
MIGADMKKIGLSGRRWLLMFHVLLASVWIGTAVSMNVIQFAKGDLPNGDELYAVNACLKLIDDFIIIPSALGILLTGLLISLLTNWGFFKFHWVAVKWIVAVSLVVFGTFWLGPWLNGMVAISDAERIASLQNPEYLHNRQMLMIFGPIQVCVLAAVTFISVFKPWGKRARGS